MTRSAPLSFLAILVGTLVGCVGATSRLGEGGRCSRTAECAPGLLCNAGVCTSDLTGFGMGMVPVTPMDAGPVDAPLDPDAFADMDAFSELDAFVEPVDAYVPPGADAWAPDAFIPPPDAFVVPVDAFTPPTPDAFSPADPDAFVPPDPDAFVDEDAAL